MDNYENDQYSYENRKNDNNSPKNKKSGKVQIVLLALVFSIIGSLIGGYVGSYFTAKSYEGNNDNTIQSTTNSGNPNAVTKVVEINDVVAEVAENTLDSVVGITTKSIAQDILLRPVEVQGTGSGIIVDSRGYILTNNHVVANASGGSSITQSGVSNDITVVLNDKTTLEAQVLWTDPQIDLAILKVESDTPLKPAVLGDSDALRIGEQAIAIGNPFSLDFGGTVTGGYISGLNRSVTTSDIGIMENLIQTDASINSGNSGGPLLNAKGEVIGVNTLKLGSGENMSFSIPINIAKPIIEEVIETGTFKSVKLGVTVVDVETYQSVFQVDLSAEHGVLLVEILKGSPAENAGLQANDIIVGIDDRAVNDRDMLTKALYNYSDGEEATLKIIRGGEEMEVNIVLSSKDYE
ncbi:MAG: trypsin-like serine protease [Tissierellia bacterium]|nr:trypsin-like serine protease [Tissierellia bacterium]